MLMTTEKWRKSQTRPLWLFTRFRCCPWHHYPCNLQAIKQTPSPPHYLKGTSSHRASGWKVESSCHSYSVQMRPLVLGTVAGVTERLLTARMLAQVRLLARVTPQVNLEIFEPWKGLLATFKLQRENNLGLLKRTLRAWVWGTEKSVPSLYLA